MADEDLLTFLNKIQTQYPQALAILTQPGVAAVFVQAVKEGWPPERLESALQQTEWWKNTPPAVRQSQALRATDPAAYGQKAEQTKRIVDDLSRELGINLDNSGGLNSPAFAFLRDAVDNGWDANEIRYRLLASVNASASGGALGAQAAKVKSLANDYGVPLADQAVMTYARRMLQGGMDDMGLQGYLIDQAKSLFPALTAALDAGITVKDYAAPYLQIAQQELEVNPADINLTDAKWMAALNQIDPNTGARVSMPLDSWLAKIRSDPAYGYDTTAKGRQDATTLATQLQQKFGAAA